ncbi:MAG: ABC transporter ATP-binding protein [Candidatus Odinarchaeota archaeon]
MRKIIFNDVSSQYRRSKKQQLMNINLEIQDGELTLLAGSSGSGKSTLVLLLNGIIPHHTRANITGTIDVFGKNPLEEPVLEMSHLVGMLLQDPDSQLATSQVKDEIILTLEFQGKNHEDIDRITDNLLEQFDIQHLAESDSTRMSGGEKQLVALAAMMSLDPSIIILDEPTSNLDPMNTARVLKHVQRFQEEGRTVILIEHKMNEVFNYCPPDRIILIDNGKVLMHQEPKVIFDSPVIQDIGLKIPDVANYIWKCGLPRRKNGSYPWSIADFDDYIQDLDNQQLEQLRQALKLPKRLNLVTNQQLLLFDNATFTYRNQARSAIENVSFSVNKGEFLAIIGNNGAGKSSLVKHVIGLNKPVLGTVMVDDTDSRELTAAKLARNVSFLFQNPDNQLFASTVLKEVKYGPINCGMDKEEAEIRAKEAIEAVKLGAYMDQNPLKLSMGQKQRVAVASSLAMSPEIIVLDEPTTGQDPISLQGIMDLMFKEYEKKVTIIMVTHDMNLVDKVANRVIVMSDRKVIDDGSTDAVFKKSDLLKKCNLEPPIRVQMQKIVEDYLKSN